MRLILLTFLQCCLMACGLAANGPKVVQVFVLAGQSNMEGQAVADLSGPDYNQGRGTLLHLLRDPALAASFQHWAPKPEGWPARDDVWVWYQREHEPLLKGPLSIGFSIYGGTHHFGPELELGRVLGDVLTNQVLLIKTAWGGKSLYEDFRPPSSGGKTGPYYTRMIEQVRQVLHQLPEFFPAAADARIELSGFVWYHGWNDGVSPQHGVPAYQTNLVNLIHDVRRDWHTPKLPVVIGELTGPWLQAPEEWSRLRTAQARVAELPEFRDNVVFVPTRNFVRPAQDSPNPTHGHHEFGNAETYLRVGEALGRGMAGLLAPDRDKAAELRNIEGWTVRIHPDLMRDHPSETALALDLLGQQLREVVSKIPSQAATSLRRVTLWFSPPYPGKRSGAEYHPAEGWLREHGRNPAMAGGVEFTNIREFRQELDRMPNFALHELAHAYHHQSLPGGFDHPQVRAAFERARDSHRYDRVERRNGNGRPNTFEKAYAMNNPQEYFAETSEAFFSRNDYFPFDRAELERHDPEMTALLLRLWNDPAAAP